MSGDVPAETRDRMLAAAESLIRERGLLGAGIKEIVRRSGTPIGSLYHHFPGGKSQLVSEALHLHASKARALLDGALARKGPLAGRIRTFFRAAAEGFDKAGGCRSCGIGNVTLDLGGTDEALRDACADAFESWIAALARRMPWREDAGRCRSFSQLIVIVLEGAFVVARATGSGHPFITAGDWLAELAATTAEPPRRRGRARRPRLRDDP